MRAVDRQAVDAVAAENFQQRGKLVLVRVADAGLHGEAAGNRLAQRSQETVDLLRFAQQAAAGVLAADDRRGAAEIEIDAGHRQRGELFRGADEALGRSLPIICANTGLPVSFSRIERRM